MPALRIFISLLLVALNGLFVAAEFAFVRIRATQVDNLVEAGRPGASLVKTATDRLDAYLAVSQLGITVCSLGIGALAEPAIATLIEPLLEALSLPGGFTHPVALAVALLFASFMHVVFGELAPKTLAIQKAEVISLFVAPFMRFFYYLLYPFTIAFNGTANTFTGLFGVPPARDMEESHTEQEIRQLISKSARSGVLEEEEEEMIGGVFELEDTRAREIMVPRPDVVSLPAEMSLRELISVAANGNYTRYPVYEEDGGEDRVIGAVHLKDVLRAVEVVEGLDSELDARSLMREVLMVPESKRIDEILEEFQEQEVQMAVVIDEWGAFEGVFTIEDILEEIVGEIRDEFDEEEPNVRKLQDGSYEIDGAVPIQVVNEALDSEFESEDFDTIGGLVLDHLGRIAEVGDEVALDGYTLHVDDMDGARISQIGLRESYSQEPADGEPG